MRLILKTRVAEAPEEVFRRFDKDLFLALVPPLTQIIHLDFGGSHTGDKVEIKLSSLGIKQHWVSNIVDHGKEAGGVYFIDEAALLPGFLSSWKHKHLIKASGTGSEIVDDISFGTPWWLPTWLLWPVLYLQFAYRGPIYKRFFGKP